MKQATLQLIKINTLTLNKSLWTNQEQGPIKLTESTNLKKKE